MNYRHLLLIGLMSLLSAPSLAFHCPMDMKKIDAALAANPPVDSQQLAQVRDLRAKGEAYHRAGNHRQSVKVLGEAMRTLGIQ